MFLDLSMERLIELYQKHKNKTATLEEESELEYRFSIASCEKEYMILRLEAAL